MKKMQSPLREMKSRIPSWINPQTIACYVEIQPLANLPLANLKEEERADAMLEVVAEINHTIICFKGLTTPINETTLVGYWDVYETPLQDIIDAAIYIRKAVASRAQVSVVISIAEREAIPAEIDHSLAAQFAISLALNRSAKIAAQCMESEADLVVTQEVFDSSESLKDARPVMMPCGGRVYMLDPRMIASIPAIDVVSESGGVRKQEFRLNRMPGAAGGMTEFSLEVVA